MPQDDLIRAANKAKARAKMQKNTYLDQRCPKEKQSLKMSLNSCDNQAEKTKVALLQTTASLPMFDQSETTKKVKKKARKKRKKENTKENNTNKKKETIVPL